MGRAASGTCLVLLAALCAVGRGGSSEYIHVFERRADADRPSVLVVASGDESLSLFELEQRVHAFGTAAEAPESGVGALRRALRSGESTETAILPTQAAAELADALAAAKAVCLGECPHGAALGVVRRDTGADVVRAALAEGAGVVLLRSMSAGTFARDAQAIADTVVAAGDGGASWAVVFVDAEGAREMLAGGVGAARAAGMRALGEALSSTEEDAAAALRQSTPVTGIRMTPGILTGLVVVGFLLFAGLTAVWCLLGIQTPRRFARGPLPGRKTF